MRKSCERTTLKRTVTFDRRTHNHTASLGNTTGRELGNKYPDVLLPLLSDLIHFPQWYNPQWFQGRELGEEGWRIKSGASWKHPASSFKILPIFYFYPCLRDTYLFALDTCNWLTLVLESTQLLPTSRNTHHPQHHLRKNFAWPPLISTYAFSLNTLILTQIKKCIIYIRICLMFDISGNYLWLHVTEIQHQNQWFKYIKSFIFIM